MQASPLAVVAAVVAAAAVTVIAASSATAAPIIRHTHITNSYTVPDDVVCGITGTAAVSIVDDFQVLGDGTAKDQLTVKDVFTSAATGNAVEIQMSDQNASSAEVVNPDGSTTMIVTEKGLLENIKLANGGVLSRDAGALTFVLTFNPDGSFRSSDLVGAGGPHPDFDSGFTVACDLITAALS
jgi:hypothetical protein